MALPHIMLSALHHYISLHLRSDLKGPLKILSATLLGPRQHFRDMLTARPCFDATSSLQDFKASRIEIVIVNIFDCIKLQNTKYQLQKKCVQYTLSSSWRLHLCDCIKLHPFHCHPKKITVARKSLQARCALKSNWCAPPDNLHPLGLKTRRIVALHWF